MPDARESLSSATSTTIRVAPLLSCACGSGSLTDKAIREGLRKLEDGSKYDNLYLAAKARSESDWLVGINGTQALSIAAGHGTYSVGRVQTPTLAMVCERYWENRRFTSEAFWQAPYRNGRLRRRSREILILREMERERTGDGTI